MYRERSVGVVIPAYNEAGFVGDVIREMPPLVDRLYVVDDRSTDGTWEEILDAAAADRAATECDGANRKSTVGERADWPATTGRIDGDGHETCGDRRDRAQDQEQGQDRHRDRADILTDGSGTALRHRAAIHDPIGCVVPIRHHENRGAGGAIKTGYLAALEEGVDATVTVDADGQMDLSQLPRLLDPIVEGTADYAKGNRLYSSEYRAAMPRFRLFGNAILTFLTKIASGYWKTMDPQNGYTAISNDALCAIDVEGLYEYYGYCNDLLVKLNASGMAVADVAMPAVYGDEESSIAYSQYVPKVSAMLLGNFLWRLRAKYLVRDFHPLALFYLVGAGTVAVGVLSLVGAFFAFVPGVDGSSAPLVFLAGVAFLLFAMVFDMAENEHLESRVE